METERRITAEAGMDKETCMVGDGKTPNKYWVVIGNGWQREVEPSTFDGAEGTQPAASRNESADWCGCMPTKEKRLKKFWRGILWQQWE